jgi:hypothetical protein
VTVRRVGYLKDASQEYRRVIEPGFAELPIGQKCISSVNSGAGQFIDHPLSRRA